MIHLKKTKRHLFPKPPPLMFTISETGPQAPTITISYTHSLQLSSAQCFLQIQQCYEFQPNPTNPEASGRIRMHLRKMLMQLHLMMQIKHCRNPEASTTIVAHHLLFACARQPDFALLPQYLYHESLVLGHVFMQ